MARTPLQGLREGIAFAQEQEDRQRRIGQERTAAKAQQLALEEGRAGLDEQQRQRRQQAALNTARLFDMAIQRGEDPEAAFDRIASVLPRFGVPEEDLPALRDTLVENPEFAGDLAGFLGETEPVRPFGAVREGVDPETGERILFQQMSDGSVRRVENVAPLPDEPSAPRRRPIRNDPNGIPRFVDTGEPVFPDVAEGGAGGEGADTGPVVELSREQISRIAPNIPSLERAFVNLQSAIEQGQTFTSGRGVVSRGRNALATGVEGFPLGGETLARTLGTTERDALRQAAATFESTILPMLSGAAVTESEARRFVRASLPDPGDSPEIMRRKLSQLQSMKDVLRRAVSGEPVNFDAIIGAADVFEESLNDEPGERGVREQTQQPVTVNTPEEAAALPPGTRFRTPDGRVMVRE